MKNINHKNYITLIAIFWLSIFVVSCSDTDDIVSSIETEKSLEDSVIDESDDAVIDTLSQEPQDETKITNGTESETIEETLLDSIGDTAIEDSEIQDSETGNDTVEVVDTEIEDTVTEDTVMEDTEIDDTEVEDVEGDFTIDAPAPRFRDVTVHDPMVTRVNGRWWVFGSHLASAHTDDLIRWTQYSARVENSNPLIPNVFTQLQDALEWADSRTLWAGSVIQLRNGTFHFYYSACEGSSPRSALGLATSSEIGGPYTHQQILLRSGMWGETGADGTIYNANIHPNAIDPHVFYDVDDNLWMIYGSYSGGIFILELDSLTGLIKPNQGWGTKLLGENHARIEAPYILYSPESQYYYLFLSYGGLSADGGYNIRIARSRTQNGPYYDPQGNNMIDCRGPRGTFFDDEAISPYGGKMIGNFRFVQSNIGYVSPGHNSAFFDESTNKHLIFFHSRFPGRGEAHSVRVHQMYLNSQDWLVIAPHRYAGETMQNYSNGEIAGNYQLVNHQRDITDEIRESVNVHFSVNGEVSGALSGSWQRTDGNKATVRIGSSDYYGVFTHNWDTGLERFVITFSGMSNGGITLFASQII